MVKSKSIKIGSFLTILKVSNFRLEPKIKPSNQFKPGKLISFEQKDICFEKNDKVGLIY
jgi:hypothetical protein